MNSNFAKFISSALAAGLLCLYLCAPVSQADEVEAAINHALFSGKLRQTDDFTAELEVEEINAPEIANRLKQFPLYGANPLQTNPRQRVIKIIRLTVNGRVMSPPAFAFRDLFDPGFVYTVRVTSVGDNIVIAWAGGSGERAYRCKFYATSDRFVRREIYQLDNQGREALSAVDF